MPRAAALLASLLVLPLAATACGGDDDQPGTTVTATAQTTTEPATTETNGFEEGTVTLESDDGFVQIRVEIADDDTERRLGLMNRESLPDDAGMLFLFEEDVSFGFWMKNTLIPLSIAFADADGEIVRILDMEPCESDPCPVYEPEATYRSALEVNQGAFADWGVAEGDRLTLDR